jgi:hypothetical protein
MLCVNWNFLNTVIRYSKTWLILNSSEQKKVFRITKNLYNSIKKKANSLLEKLVFLLLVSYAIACHAITVTNWHFTQCSVVINLMFNMLKPLPTVTERTAKNER